MAATATTAATMARKMIMPGVRPPGRTGIEPVAGLEHQLAAALGGDLGLHGRLAALEQEVAGVDLHVDAEARRLVAVRVEVADRGLDRRLVAAQAARRVQLGPDLHPDRAELRRRLGEHGGARLREVAELG